LETELKGHFLELATHDPGVYILFYMINRAEIRVVQQIETELNGQTQNLLNDKNGYDILKALKRR